jgi:hypothetical protein
MKYMTAAAVAGAFLALGAAGTAHADTAHHDTTHGAATGTDHPTHDTDAPRQQITQQPATPTRSLSTDDLGQLLTAADKVTDVLRHGYYTRDKGSLVDSGPRRTGMTIADVPLGVARPD